MKDYLFLLKQKLIKNKDIYIQKNEKREDDNKIIFEIANTLGLEFAMHNLRQLPTEGGVNRYSMDDNNMVYLYPVNDGLPTCPFEFYKGSKLVMNNQKVYSEITNLDEIILQMVRIFDKALDEGIVLDPYYFMLRLDDEVQINYKGNATLIITEKAIRNQKLNKQNFDEAKKYFINKFLDRFIGWNFGVSINRNKILKSELIKLNIKVVDMGIREYAGTGFEVYGTESEAYNGLQHYYLPTDYNLNKKQR